MLGIEPLVEVVVESFLALRHFIVGTNRLGLLQAALAPAVPDSGRHPLLRAPFDATPIVNALWWHPVHDRDPEHAWMRSVFLEAAREVQSTVAAGDRCVEPIDRAAGRAHPLSPPAKPWMKRFCANM